MRKQHNLAIFYAIMAAVLYAISSPVSKLLLNKIPPTFLAALLYLGAGMGMFIIGLCRGLYEHGKGKGNKGKDSKGKDSKGKVNTELKLGKAELPYIIGMIVLDIVAPILLMLGLSKTTSANASLLNNFEIVATSIIAFFIFREYIHRRLWFAIILITLSSCILSFENINSFSFSLGSLFVILATICWGFENNCTRMLSSKDPLQIVTIKGIGSGLGSLIIAFILNETVIHIGYIIASVFLGFISYGLSIYFYVYAQRDLGAAKTSAYYAIAPFVGVLLSFIIFQQIPRISFFIALFIMIVGTYFASTNSKYKEN